jgi:4,5:9,10-diseco-3-hydroxy-5,9,17-trioxoandrosta-1(10),2-diene-4-oate hydrolase
VTTFVEHRLQADGFDIRFAQAGEGPPLVCFHGAGGLRISPAHELLAERHRVIAFEAPGFGDSPVNERSQTMADLAATMTTAIDALGLDHFNLWGTSFGGRLALYVAVGLGTGRDRLQSLVLASPAAILIGPRVAATPERLYIHPERRPTDGPPPPEVLAQQGALVDRLIDMPRDPVLEAAMRELATPTLVLFGSADEMTPPELGRHYRELLPNCHFVIVYDAGHALDGDRPEAFAAIVTDFIAHREQFVVRRESRLLYP